VVLSLDQYKYTNVRSSAENIMSYRTSGSSMCLWTLEPHHLDDSASYFRLYDRKAVPSLIYSLAPDPSKDHTAHVLQFSESQSRKL